MYHCGLLISQLVQHPECAHPSHAPLGNPEHGPPMKPRGFGQEVNHLKRVLAENTLQALQLPSGNSADIT